MKLLTIPEHTKVYRDTSLEPIVGFSEKDGRYYLPDRLFERLAAYDESLAKSNGDAGIFTWYRHWFKAGSVVGVLQLRGLTVEILPKIEKVMQPGTQQEVKEECEFLRKNLLYMLAVAGDLPLRERDLAALEARPAPLSDVLIRIFAERLMTELQRGLDRGYVNREENLHTLKGKLLTSKHVLSNVAHKERFLVRYQDFIADTTLNRIFKAACTLLVGQTSSGKNQQLLRFCLFMLDEVSDGPVGENDFKRIIINRQNERFEELLNFCRLILTQHSPTASRGKEKTFSLLFDMNAVFEGFISQFLKRFVVSKLEDTRITLQGKRDVRYLLGPKYLRLKPDIMIEQGMQRMILDTKWKIAWNPSGRTKISSGDGYQLYAYAHRFDATRCLLLYPQVPGAKYQDFPILENDDDSPRTIAMAPLDLSGSLRTRKNELIAGLSNLLEGCPL